MPRLVGFAPKPVTRVSVAAAAGPAAATSTATTDDSTSVTASRHLRAVGRRHMCSSWKDVRDPGATAQERVHRWLACPLQVQRMVAVPFAVPAWLTSRQSPDPTLRTD